MKCERMASANYYGVTAQDGLYMVQLVFAATEYVFLVHYPFFFSLDGKETKDQAPSMLPPHKMLTHPSQRDRLLRRSSVWLVQV